MPPAKAEGLRWRQLDRLVTSGNTVIVVEHEMRVAAASDYVIDMGPGAGADGGRIIVAGAPVEVAATTESRTALYLQRALNESLEQPFASNPAV